MYNPNMNQPYPNQQPQQPWQQPQPGYQPQPQPPQYQPQQQQWQQPPPQQPQWQPQAQPGMAPMGQPQVPNFGFVDNVDGEAGGQNLPAGDYWIRISGVKFFQSRDPRKAGKQFLVIKNQVINSLNPQSPVQPGYESGHVIDSGNATALARIMKNLLGHICGVPVNTVKGEWISKVISNPESVIDCVVQVQVLAAKSEKGIDYLRWTPVGFIQDSILMQYLASLRPEMKQSLFPNGLRSERGAPAPRTFFEGAAAQVVQSAVYPPQTAPLPVTPPQQQQWQQAVPQPPPMPQQAPAHTPWQPQPQQPYPAATGYPAMPPQAVPPGVMPPGTMTPGGFSPYPSQG